MQEIIISDEELDELLQVLYVAQGDSDVASNLSRDIEELDAYRAHRKIIRKWINRLQGAQKLRK